jgi:hypothetical protein
MKASNIAQPRPLFILGIFGFCNLIRLSIARMHLNWELIANFLFAGWTEFSREVEDVQVLALQN